MALLPRNPVPFLAAMASFMAPTLVANLLLFLVLFMAQVKWRRHPWVYYVTCSYLAISLPKLCETVCTLYSPMFGFVAHVSHIDPVAILLSAQIFAHLWLIWSYGMGRASRAYYGLPPRMGSLWKSLPGTKVEQSDNALSNPVAMAPPKASLPASHIACAAVVGGSLVLSLIQEIPVLPDIARNNMVPWWFLVNCVFNHVVELIVMGSLLSRLHRRWVYYFISVYLSLIVWKIMPYTLTMLGVGNQDFMADRIPSSPWIAIYNWDILAINALVAWRFIWGAPSRRSYGLENPWSADPAAS